MRYYHGFTLGELRRLAGAVGFSIIENKRSGNVRRSGDVNLVTICRKPVGRESQAVMTGLE
jgi:hypothetical protein